MRELISHIHKLNKKDDANGSIAMIFVLIGAFMFVLVAYASLTIAMLISHQHDVDDALADAVLASCIADREYYFYTREGANGEDTAVVRFLDMNACANNFTSCLYADIHSSCADFFENMKIEELTFYEVEGSTVKVTTFAAGEGGAFPSNTWSGAYGAVTASTGAVVERTSVYAKISFDVQAYFMFDIRQNVSRELYSTIKVDDVRQHIGYGE